MIGETVYPIDYNPHCLLCPRVPCPQLRRQNLHCILCVWFPPGLHNMVALAPSIAHHSAFYKSQTSWPKNEPDRIKEKLVGPIDLQSWDGWGLQDYKVLLKLPKRWPWVGTLGNRGYTMIKGYYHQMGYMCVWSVGRLWKEGFWRNMSFYSKYCVSRWDSLRDHFLLPTSMIFCIASIKCPFVAPKEIMVLPQSLSLLPSAFHIKLCIMASHPIALCIVQGQRPSLNHLCAPIT